MDCPRRYPYTVYALLARSNIKTNLGRRDFRNSAPVVDTTSVQMIWLHLAVRGATILSRACFNLSSFQVSLRPQRSLTLAQHPESFQSLTECVLVNNPISPSPSGSRRSKSSLRGGKHINSLYDKGGQTSLYYSKKNQIQYCLRLKLRT